MGGLNVSEHEAQAPRPTSAARLFGAELRAARARAGLSLAGLSDRFRAQGRVVHRGYLTNVENGDRFPTDRHFAEIADRVLATDGLLARLWDFADTERACQYDHALATRRLVAQFATDTLTPVISGDIVFVPHIVGADIVAYMRMSRRAFLATGGLAAAGITGRPGHLRPAAHVGADRFGFGEFVARAWPDLTLSRLTPDGGADWSAAFPAGRWMLGARTGLQVHPATLDEGRVVLQIDGPDRAGELLSRPERGLLVGAVNDGDQPRFFALDGRSVAGQVNVGDAAGAVVPVPVAYELDDVTYAVLWAASNYDDALQADDQALHEARAGLMAYERLSASAVSREAAPGLNPVSRMWLGSQFCARHILRVLPDLPSLPVFWTREQRGEEASAWLFFDHKYPYLQATTDNLGACTTRTFCVPEPVVRDSPRHERILMFLAVALMESLGIQAQFTSDPVYEPVEGFVVSPNREAVIANWVRGDGMWHVDVTGRSSVVRELSDVAGDVADRSIIKAATPAARLRLLAAYLDLPWVWLVVRCASLARHGTTGLIRPRSRMISMAGLDAACAYVGSLPAAG
jgi:transcriptional regulator with XRE-family HTH domain